MGTLIQRLGLKEEDFRATRFANHTVPLSGNNDVLNLTQPEAVMRIHQQYIDSGADIISTNTFSSQRISQKDYACDAIVSEMALQGALIARRVADACTHRKIWVAGSMGPTNRTLSMASDINKPDARDLDFDELRQAYYEQARALAEGGVDVFLLETCFDALNTKAALAAISQVNSERMPDEALPVMVSVTINDRSGRTLTGQTLEAFFVSVSHYPIISFGLNCSFGIEALMPFVRQLAEVLPVAISVHPNAGMPNEMGEYDEQPEYTASHLKTLAEEGCVNIVGGCCGTTPQHIKAISQAVRGCKPHQITAAVSADNHVLRLSGLEPLTIDKSLSNFINVGERTNVAGSRKFAKLIAAHDYEAAADVARKQIEGGAAVVDINMDDAMLDSAEEMKHFVRFISNDPSIARVPLMIDSSDWATVLEGLKNSQGKCIVNSISLKNGEDDLLHKAATIKQLGAAVVVMAFDEEGQATTYSRKIAICQRAYKLLTQRLSFAPEDIIFDVNVLSVGTGIAEHARYGIDFINAVAWIRQNLPYAKTSGGLSNLSFAFRGNNTVREAMHSVFLYHAIQAGLDMAIMNPTMIQVYDEIDPELKRCCEDVILDRSVDATEALIDLATKIKAEADAAKAEGTQSVTAVQSAQAWRSGTVDERLAYALSHGVSDYLSTDIKESLDALSGNAVSVIEGPLMAGMERVGKLFGEGKMFLPQVVKAAKVMRQAVEILQPYIEEHGSAAASNQKPKIVMATAKGDVHDIGKNIVDIVLRCNNFDVIDLGVMVDSEAILEATMRWQPLLVGVSGLITPSLKEMEKLCQLFECKGMTVPIFVGGATTSDVHTAVKLAPLYSGGVFYGSDASATSVLAKKYLAYPKKTIADNLRHQQHVREVYESRRIVIDDYQKANACAPVYDMSGLSTMADVAEANYAHPTIADVVPLINWNMLLYFWGLHASGSQAAIANGEGDEADRLVCDAKNTLRQMMTDSSLSLKTILKMYAAHREGNDIVLSSGLRLPMLRSQRGRYECLADFLPTDTTAPMGLLCVTVHDLQKDNISDVYQKLMRYAVRARVAEAAAEWIQHRALGSVNAIRPAFGYAACPDHQLKKVVVNELQAEQKLGLTLTANCSIYPSTTICGMLIAHPDAHYFSVGKISEEQFLDYIRRMNVSEECGRQFLADNL